MVNPITGPGLYIFPVFRDEIGQKIFIREGDPHFLVAVAAPESVGRYRIVAVVESRALAEAVRSSILTTYERDSSVIAPWLELNRNLPEVVADVS